VGRLVDRDAYAWLPSSVTYLPDEARMMAMLTDAGFRDLNKRRLLGGAVQLITGHR
jgi:ubiquinone/menaquinone biosynthesis C-methylase UbiE